MKVFISWSGDRSRALATALKDFLPDVNNSIEAWMSEQDIGPGSRWNQELARELDSNSFGVICLTPESLISPWVLFEAGALSKSVDEAHVTPYRLGLDSTDVPYPMAQFQGVDANEAGTKRLVECLNEACEIKIESDRLARQFSRVWPDLKSSIERIPERQNQAPAHRSERELLEEILELTREIRVRGFAQSVSDARSILERDDARSIHESDIVLSDDEIRMKRFMKSYSLALRKVRQLGAEEARKCRQLLEEAKEFALDARFDQAHSNLSKAKEILSIF